jgi:hypothetical protein
MYLVRREQRPSLRSPLPRSLHLCRFQAKRGMLSPCCLSVRLDTMIVPHAPPDIPIGAASVSCSDKSLDREATMRFRTSGIMLLSAMTLAASAAAQTTQAPPAITRTVVAATKLPTATDVPLYFKAVSVTMPGLYLRFSRLPCLIRVFGGCVFTTLEDYWTPEEVAKSSIGLFACSVKPNFVCVSHDSFYCQFARNCLCKYA